MPDPPTLTRPRTARGPADGSIPQVETLPQPLGSRLIDVTVAGALLLVGSPLLLATGLLVRIVDGPPVLYRGERMGHGARPFTLYKIRTLRTDAQATLGGQLLRDGHGLKTRTGNFFRETRLDEMPQLWSVIKGDMALFGPRPERREVFEAHCKDIPGYEERFRVRPGVFGYAQVLTPHGTPKRIRSMLDRRFAQHPPSTLYSITLISLTVFALLREVALRVFRFFREFVRSRLLRRHPERRRELRVRPQATVELGGQGAPLRVLDANEHAMLVAGDEAEGLRPGDRRDLRIHLPGSRRVRWARIEVESVAARRLEGARPAAVLRFRCPDLRSHYVLEQYLLRRSIVDLPRVIRRRRARTLGARRLPLPWPR